MVAVSTQLFFSICCHAIEVIYSQMEFIMSSLLPETTVSIFKIMLITKMINFKESSSSWGVLPCRMISEAVTMEISKGS